MAESNEPSRVTIAPGTIAADEDEFVVESTSTAAETEDETPVRYEILGDDYEILPEDEEVNLHTTRIKDISNLSDFPRLKKLVLVASLVEKIDGLESLTELEHLELYQAKVRRIENIESQSKLKVLDLSFNAIRRLCNIRHLTELESLYLPSNKIEEVKDEEVSSLTKLKLLELGANRIRAISGLDKLVALEALWLGKNRITSMKIPLLDNLRTVDLRSNRITTWDDSILQLPALEELYLSHNQIGDPPSEDYFSGKVPHLKIIDMSSNAITSMKPFTMLKGLTELYLSDNKLVDESELPMLKSFKKLDTLYLQFNEIQKRLGPMYRNRTITNCCSLLLELDGNDVIRLG